MLLLLAQMTQEDVFKSISQNVSGDGPAGEAHGRTLFAVILGAVAIILLLWLFSARNKREANPKAINHPGRLLKEIMKQVPLKPAELKQLKLMAEAERQGGVPVENPLIFVLCPSVLAGAMRAGRAKIDRKVMSGLARKMGLVSKVAGKR